MNVFNKILLKAVLLPSGVYEKMGVNVRHLRAILMTKLIMDDRRPNSFQQMRRQARKKPISNATLSTMAMSIIAGVLFVFISAFLKNTVTQLTIYFSFYITFLASILIADFTSVLIDVRDTYIILPKPVTDRTVVLSRLLHIFIHICKTALPMCLPGAVYFTYTYNALVLLVFLLMVGMAILFTIFLINACYIFILKITTPQKFQNIISYIQIVFAVFFYACYQIVPRVATRFSGFDITRYKSAPLFPSYWFAAAVSQAWQPVNSLQVWLCVLLSLIAPLLSLWVVIKYFAPSFNQKLALISAGTTEAGGGDSKLVPQAKGISGYSKFMAQLFTKKGAERAAFIFTWQLMIRSRDFKMKVYPAIGYVAVIIVLTMFNIKISVQDITGLTAKGKSAILIIIYFSNLLLVSGLGQLIYYEKYKAAWVFYSAPIEVPGKIVSGAVKACIAQFFFPIALIIFLVLTGLAGVSILPNILLGFSNAFLLGSLAGYFIVNRLPFSCPPNIKASRGTLRIAMVSIFGFVMASIQYSIINITPVVIIFTLLSAGAAWLLLDSIKKLSWQKINANYED